MRHRGRPADAKAGYRQRVHGGSDVDEDRFGVLLSRELEPELDGFLRGRRPIGCDQDLFQHRFPPSDPSGTPHAQPRGCSASDPFHTEIVPGACAFGIGLLADCGRGELRIRARK